MHCTRCIRQIHLARSIRTLFKRFTVHRIDFFLLFFFAQSTLIRTKHPTLFKQFFSLSAKWFMSCFMAFVVKIAASDQLCQTASLRWNFLPLSLSFCLCVCLCRMLSVLCVWHLFFKWIFHHSPYPGGKFDLFKYFKTKYCCGMCLKHKIIDCNSQQCKRIAF